MESNLMASNAGILPGGISYVNPPIPELGMTERASCVASGLQALFDKMGNLRDKIEGNSQASGKPCTPVSGGGLRGHITEAESILSACHSLLDDIAGKF